MSSSFWTGKSLFSDVFGVTDRPIEHVGVTDRHRTHVRLNIFFSSALCGTHRIFTAKTHFSWRILFWKRESFFGTFLVLQTDLRYCYGSPWFTWASLKKIKKKVIGWYRTPGGSPRSQALCHYGGRQFFLTSVFSFFFGVKRVTPMFSLFPFLIFGKTFNVF